jgi:hypothetical protein
VKTRRVFMNKYVSLAGQRRLSANSNRVHAIVSLATISLMSHSVLESADTFLITLLYQVRITLEFNCHW